MILPASYANGFAPRDGQPLHPSLWRNCVGAWAPCLGPTGLTLRDWSGYANSLSLTNMSADSDWTISGGSRCLDFDGSNDYADTSNVSRYGFSGPQMVSFWFRNTTTLTLLNFPTIFAYGATAVDSYKTQIMAGFNTVGTGPSNNTGKLAIMDYNGAVVSGAYSSTDFQSNLNWNHAAGGWDGTAWTIYINGINETTSQGTQDAPATTSHASATLVIGRASIGVGRYSPTQMDDVRYYHRSLSPQEIRLLASRRGIAYEMAPRRRASVQVAASFNRRRRLLLGASN